MRPNPQPPNLIPQAINRQRPLNKRKLPIGIESFSRIRQEGYYYVDKTAFIERLVSEGDFYFLSRPRRFGKSLFLSTIKALFEGRQELFEGLRIYDQWDWSARHPIVHLNFGWGDFSDDSRLGVEIEAQLSEVEQLHGISAPSTSPAARFRNLVKSLHNKTGQRVVVIIDEYDKPILDVLPTPEVARTNRDFLRGFYGVLKGVNEHLRFVFLTGVSKFSKVSLFSGLNNLIDVSLDRNYSSICGYTEKDLDEVFADELTDLDREQVRQWYNGYSWLGTDRLYNPFDVLMLFRKREFRAWWFESGTPTFLVESLTERKIASLSLDGMIASDSSLSTFDVGDMAPEALLFQTGYLTIQDEESQNGKRFYRLGYPNREVRQGLNESLLRWLVQDPTPQESISAQLLPLLRSNDFDGLRTLLESFYTSIPHQWYTNNDIANYEGYYASVFYSYFASLGLDIIVEDSSLRGRADMRVLFDNNLYLFEFKVVEKAGEGSAMAQLKAKNYADKYRASGRPVYLVGVEFSSERRALVGFEVESP